MAVNKNFVVKNGIEVATDLIYATSDLDKVGIGSTIPTSTLEVGGDFKATGNSTVVGFATVQDTFEVGVGGTVITADVQAGRIGLNTATAHHNVHISNVGTGDTTLFVDGGDVKVDGNIYADNLGITGDVNAINLRVTGITTLGDGVGADKVDINTSVDLDGDLDVLGVSTFTGDVNVTGVASITSDLYVGGNLNVTGDITYDEVTGRNINITGVSTFGTVQISGGIVTATSGIVTYYGDGSNLSGVATNLVTTIGIQSGGTPIGTGITSIDFTGTNATITVAADSATPTGVATVNIAPSVSLGLVIALGG